jgi:FMN-dependent NADH-azoreductase
MGDESKAKALESARSDIVRAAAAANQEAAIAA